MLLMACDNDPVTMCRYDFACTPDLVLRTGVALPLYF
jgi:hypothetical protein